MLAAQLREALAEVPDVSEVTLIGGRPREIHVDVDPATAGGGRPRSAASLRVRSRRRTRASTAHGSGQRRQRHATRGRQATSSRVDALRDVVVSGAAGRSVLLRDVADGHRRRCASRASYVRYHARTEGAHPAVTIAVAKRKGANAITVAHPSSRSSTRCAASCCHAI